MMLSPGPHWWEASALTTAPSLHHLCAIIPAYFHIPVRTPKGPPPPPATPTLNFSGAVVGSGREIIRESWNERGGVLTVTVTFALNYLITRWQSLRVAVTFFALCFNRRQVPFTLLFLCVTEMIFTHHVSGIYVGLCCTTTIKTTKK